MISHIAPHPLDGTSIELQTEALAGLMRDFPELTSKQAGAIVNLIAAAAEAELSGASARSIRHAIAAITIRTGGAA